MGGGTGVMMRRRWLKAPSEEELGEGKGVSRSTREYLLRMALARVSVGLRGGR